jgi:hypothetical protein
MRQGATRNGAKPASVADATAESNAANWFVGVLALAAAVAAELYFKVPLRFDFKSPDFNPFVLVPVALALFGLGYLAVALVGTLRRRRFGESRLETEAASVAPGETLRGRVKTAVELRPTGEVTIRLRCIEADRLGRLDAARERTQDHVRWQEETRIDGATVDSRAGIPFAIAIPATALAVGDRRAQGAVRWILEVRAPLAGQDYYAFFGVDVRQRA